MVSGKFKEYLEELDRVARLKSVTLGNYLQEFYRDYPPLWIRREIISHIRSTK